MIICKICNKEFDNMITSTHLKTHNITSAEYKLSHGDLVSEEYRNLQKENSSGKNNGHYGKRHSEETKKIISEKKKGSIPHNLNKSLSDEQKQKLSQKALARNAIWRSTDSNPNTGTTRSDETKLKIKEKRKQQIITTKQVQKAINTKRQKGYNLAFFVGKKHSQESREKISIKSKISGQRRSKVALENAKIRLREHGYEMIDFDEKHIVIKCNCCRSKFTSTRQHITVNSIRKEMCFVCYPRVVGVSKQELEIGNFLEQYTDVIRKDTTIISPKELDIFLPEINLAIEYDGLYWHSEKFKHENYHLDKLNQCIEKNVTLIHIFEDEWINNSEIVKSNLLTALGLIDHKISARRCIIKEIDEVITSQFLESNHLQGSKKSTIRLGLFHENELVKIMTFFKEATSDQINSWELSQFCSVLNTVVVDGAKKLFDFFVKKYSPSTIISLVDKRWSGVNSVYQKLGFILESETSPNCWYVKPNKRILCCSLNEQKELTLTEQENYSDEGQIKIYDCGEYRYKWTNSSIIKN